LAFILIFAFISTAMMSISSGEKEKTKYKIDTEKSKVKWRGEKYIGESQSGVIDIKKGFIEYGDKGPKSCKVIIDMESIKCTDDMEDKWKNKLVNHLKSPDFFSVDSFPTAKFVCDNFVPVEGKSHKYKAKGKMTIKGNTNTLTIPVGTDRSGENAHATAKFSFDRSKWNVRYGSKSFFDSLGDKAIKDMIKIEFYVKAYNKGT
ncbi:MAG: YceI family protein, partial [Flavobacteriales bacterium]